MPDKPHLLIVGGPNGCGKTTVAMQYATAADIPYIGADAIAASLSPDDPASARVEAGRRFIGSVAEAIASNESCVVESLYLDDPSVSTCWSQAEKALRSPLSLYLSIRLTFALRGSPSAFAKVVMTFLQQISDVAKIAAFGTLDRLS